MYVYTVKGFPLSNDNSIINFLENHHIVLCECKTTSFYIATAVHKGPGFFHILCNAWYLLCLHDNHSSGCELISHWGFDMVLVLLNIFFMCLLAIHVSSLEKCVFKSFAHWWIRLFLSVSLEVLSILNINIIIKYDSQIYLPFCGLSFYSIVTAIWCTEVSVVF